MGCCLGGGFALLLAPQGRFDASSVNYGTAPKHAYDAAFLAGACPVVASYGGRDHSLRGAAERLERALTAAGVEHDVKEYPDAGHTFMNEHTGEEIPAVFAVYGNLSPDAGYHEPSATDARRRIIAFFDAHLTPPPPRTRDAFYTKT